MRSSLLDVTNGPVRSSATTRRPAITSEIIDVTGVEVLRDRVVRLVFDNGQVRDIDLAPLMWGPAFEPLADDDAFAQVRVDSDAGTIVWPGGADISAHTLYAMSSPVTKQRTI